MHHRIVALALTTALVLGLAACGDDDGPSSDGTTTTGAASSEPDPDGSTTSTAPGATTAPTTDGPAPTTDPADLPGEAIEIYPYEGATLAVVGVAADDTLNVRSGPGTAFDVVTELDPLSEEAVATGHNRDIGDAVWAEVEAGDVTGWVNVVYVAQAGATTDITADVPATSAATVAALARAVAGTRVGEGPQPTITIVAGPTATEVTVDVIGLADDSLKGERLRIEATAGGDGVTATSVEATALCARGVTPDGLCT